MLAWAGRGVAMANGHPAVRAAAADITTETNEDDGVAAYLERLFALI
jgi:hydroxymethylpyrimidine pyrophosphatase-like HAD family hydrolase